MLLFKLFGCFDANHLRRSVSTVAVGVALIVMALLLSGCTDCTEVERQEADNRSCFCGKVVCDNENVVVYEEGSCRATEECT